MLNKSLQYNQGNQISWDTLSMAPSSPVLMMRVHTMCTTVIASLSKRHHLGSFDAGADSGIRPGALCADLDWQLLHCGHFALPASTLQLPTILCLVRCVQQFTVRAH